MTDDKTVSLTTDDGFFGYLKTIRFENIFYATKLDKSALVICQLEDFSLAALRAGFLKAL